jgi:LPS sulfotransferase NodH
MSDSAKTKSSKAVETNHYSLLAARFWHGMPIRPLAQIFRMGKYRNVGLIQSPMVGSAWFAAIVNSMLGAIQRVRYDKKIAATQIEQPPLFIVGHWRSGTTLLHEYLSLDDTHTSPNTYECFAPAHCVVSEWLFGKCKFLLPSKRPMDNMLAGWERPQEDEFALMNLGLPSPYRQIAFPNNPPVDLEYLDFEGVSPEDRRRWQDTLRHFFQIVAMRRPGKRIVVKTPQHLGRLSVLQEMFPEARFVHIVRDPYKVFPSTVKLWKSLYKVQAFQTAKCDGLEDYVFQCFERMYAQFERDRAAIDPSRLCDIRYEDLVADPAGELEAIYDKLDLGDFDRVRAPLAAYLDTTKDYKTNKFQLDDSLREQIDRRWGHWMRPFGYCGAQVALSGG